MIFNKAFHLNSIEVIWQTVDTMPIHRIFLNKMPTSGDYMISMTKDLQSTQDPPFLDYVAIYSITLIDPDTPDLLPHLNIQIIETTYDNGSIQY